MNRHVFLEGLAAAALAPTLARVPVARAQGGYPENRSAWSSRSPRGGTTDLLARAVGQHMQEAWGQVVVADNRTGAALAAFADFIMAERKRYESIVREAGMTVE